MPNGRRFITEVATRRAAVAAVLLAHRLDRQAAAQRHLLGADVARERRRLFHAEVEQDRLVATPLDQPLDEHDVLTAGVEVADDDDALFRVHGARGWVADPAGAGARLDLTTCRSWPSSFPGASAG